MLFKRKPEETIEDIEKSIFLSLQYFRLKYDLDSINEELKSYELMRMFLSLMLFLS